MQVAKSNIEDKLKIFKKQNIRLLPQKYLSNVGYLIYGDIVVIGLIQEKEITMIKITSEDFVKGFKNYFDIMWNIGKSI